MDKVTKELLHKLCEDLCIEAESLDEPPSAEFIVKIFTALTSIEIDASERVRRTTEWSPVPAFGDVGRLTEEKAKGSIGEPKLTQMIEEMIHILATEIIQTPLDHLKAEEIVAGRNEAIYDLLEILSACFHLRDESLSSYETLSSSSSSRSLYSAMSALGSTSRDSVISSDSSATSSGNNTTLTTPTFCSEATRDIEVPCFLCEYLAKHAGDETISCSETTAEDSPALRSTCQGSHVRVMSASVFDRVTKEDPTSAETIGFGTKNRSLPELDGVTAQTGNLLAPKPTEIISQRPSKMNRPTIPTNVDRRLALRREQMARKNAEKMAPTKKNTQGNGRQEWKTTEMPATRESEPVRNPATCGLSPTKGGTVLTQRNKSTGGSPRRTKSTNLTTKSQPEAKSNFIIGKRIPLNPKNIPAPSNGLEHPGNLDLEDAEEEEEVNEPELSPHMTRVLRKQYGQHLQWMASHGASESGLNKLERDYEDLIERHSRRVKQMRKEACYANRASLVKAHKGIAQTVRNLKTHARTQACQLAHSQLETERLQRAKDAKLRLAEEKLLRETFAEAMRIQKEQLLDFKKQMASQRVLEGDKHRIYMQGLEHFYRTQLDMLGEALNSEFRNGEMRNSAQMALLRGMRKELKDKLNKEVAFLKELVFLEGDKTFEDRD